MKTIEKFISQDRYESSVSYNEYFEHNNKKFKIDIKSDVFSHQCHAIVYVLSELKWNELFHIPYSNMKTELGLIHVDESKISENDFKEDIKYLKKMVKELVN